jgi:acyl-CoA thioesterase FadM
LVFFEREIRIETKHLDEGGHASCLQQQTLAQEFHYECRELLGFGLKTLSDMGLFFVVRKTATRYRKQLFLNDLVTLRLEISLFGRTQLFFRFEIRRLGDLATEISWWMPLVQLGNRKVEDGPMILSESIPTLEEKIQEPHPV